MSVIDVSVDHTLTITEDEGPTATEIWQINFGNSTEVFPWITISGIITDDTTKDLGDGVTLTMFMDPELQLWVSDWYPPNPPNPNLSYDTILIDPEVNRDYFWINPDDPGGKADMRIEGLSAGTYNITVFEGRNDEQEGKLWVSNRAGDNEPDVPNILYSGGGGKTTQVNVNEGDYLWYQHIEDNAGGISGMIIRRIDSSLFLITLTNAVASLAEDADTSGATKIADIVITDADGGINQVTLSGDDKDSFEVVGSELRLKAGVALDYETKTSYAVTLTTGSVSVDHTLAITDVDDTGSYTTVKGDVNNDGGFNGADVVSLASWVARFPTQVDEANADHYFAAKADVNGDGAVNGADVVYMASSVASLSGFVISGNIPHGASASHAAAASVQQTEPLRAILATAAVRRVPLPSPASYTHPLRDTGSTDTIEIVDIFEGL